MRQRLGKLWRTRTIKQKIKLFTDAVFFIILLSIFLAVWAIKASLLDFSAILMDNSLAGGFGQCMEAETELFESYVRNGNDDAYMELQQAMENTARAVEQLPYDYKKTGEKRYARTWAVRNLYAVYCEKRDLILQAEEKSAEYIGVLYEVYDMQDFLQRYAGQLMRDTMEDGADIYAGKVETIIIVPALIIVTEILFFLCIRKLSGLMNRSIVAPVAELAEASRKIAENDFSIADVPTQNEDELGDLVRAFNKMKYATGEYIMALEERRKALDLYHAEELEKVEIAGRLDAMELALLKSQINPHFLFNTLNVIGGMADLEGAQTTERMIHALSYLFRYNLKTPEETVPLARELKVIRDYMFLQEMRFGSRITCGIDCQVDGEAVMIPAFTFQPLVENAIIHGLAPKEDGGRIQICIRERNGMIRIVVADNGVGMERNALTDLRRRMENEDTGRGGIGLLNICKRLHIMYEAGRMRIYSRKGHGTIVSIRIPDGKGRQLER